MTQIGTLTQIGTRISPAPRSRRHFIATAIRGSMCLVLGALLLSGGCGSALNPAFLNLVTGGVVPLTPGPGADFVLVRGVNLTTDTVEFVITIERESFARDENGNVVVDESGNFITIVERETNDLCVPPGAQSADVGILFPCADSAIKLIGLGENLLSSDVAARVGGDCGPGGQGVGVRATDVNPLSLEEGNFNCGDTVIFQAIQRPGVAGGVALQSYLLPGSEQPSIFSGPDTFVNFQQFLESQVREDEP